MVQAIRPLPRIPRIPRTAPPNGSTVATRIRDSSPLSALLSVLLAAVWRSWPAVLACVAFGGAVALLRSRSVTPIYESTATLQIDPDLRSRTRERAIFREWALAWNDTEDPFEIDFDEQVKTQLSLMSSESLLSEVARDLALPADRAVAGERAGAAPIEEVTAMLRSRLTVGRIPRTQLVYIRYRDEDPERARRICESIARTVIAVTREKDTSATSEEVSWLSAQTDSAKLALESSENRLEEFKRQNELPSSSPDDISQLVHLELRSYDTTLMRTRTRKQELLARAQALSKIRPDSPDDVPASELLSNRFLTTLRGQYLQALGTHEQLIANGKGERHPLILAADAGLQKAKQAVLLEISNIQGSVDFDLRVIERKERGEVSLYEDAQKKESELELKELEYKRLDRVRAQNEKEYRTLLGELTRAKVARSMDVDTVFIVDPPLKPKAPALRSDAPMNTRTGLLFGLLFGMAVALVRQQLDSAVRVPEDLERKLGLVSLGFLPRLNQNGEAPGLGAKRRGPGQGAGRERPVECVVHDQPLSGFAEAARTIRTNLLFTNPDRPFRKLLVSSAVPSEGKTMVASSIAIAFAQRGQRVCIVDCDLRRPRLHRIFDRAGDAGLESVLLGTATIEEVAKPSRVHNLWSIPAGALPPNPAEILQSNRFRILLDELTERFDRVVIDSPPLAAVTDSAVISKLVDGTVFVVRAGTSQYLCARALRAVRDVDARIIGAVVNAADLHKWS